ncbi:MAG TPA: hypothetical protein VNO75_05390 [Gemmatimonadaceae bacterium]|nr:hypothetical protein [Gemmatimonadaceae bacterium]
MRIIAIGFCALALSAAAATAQQAPLAVPAPESPLFAPAAQAAASGPAVAAPAAGPTLESATAGIRVTADKSESLTAAAQVRRGQGKDVALMVVGVGAMIVGAIVGDDAGTVILIGGAALALWGLYNYLE